MGGVIQMARATFAAAIGAENYASRYWQAGGAPNLVLETDAVLDQSKSDDLTDRWRQKRALGPDYPPVMSSGIKVKELGADITAESAVEARKVGDAWSWTRSSCSTARGTHACRASSWPPGARPGCSPRRSATGSACRPSRTPTN
jgi:hypothetical protein